MDEKKFAGTPAETDKAKAVQGEALNDEALDAVAGGYPVPKHPSSIPSDC